MNEHLAKEDIRMASKQMKTGSMSYVTRETKIKAARSHCVSVSTASRALMETDTGEDAEQQI